MGSTAELLVWGPRAEILATRAVAHLEGLEQCWSRFRPDSALSAVNAHAGRGPQTVHGPLALALARAREAHTLTSGRFDPTILTALRALGYDRTFAKVRGRVGSAPDRAMVPGFDYVHLEGSATSMTIELAEGVGIDLGGIGKGLAADLVVADLREQGAVSVCCSLGGDIRVAGPGPDADGTWSIPVEDPRTDRRLFSFDLLDDAIAQSSTLVRRWRRTNGSDHHHLLDPRTGAPTATDLVGAVVTTRDAWEADVLAKTAVVAGSVDALPMLFAAGADGWLFPADGPPVATLAVRNTLETQ